MAELWKEGGDSKRTFLTRAWGWVFMGGMLRMVMTLLVIGSATFSRGEDWPQFLGPRRDGTSTEKVKGEFPSGEPKAKWKKAVGQGFAGPVVSKGKLIIFHRLGANDLVQCLQAESGEEIWKFTYPTRYTDDFGFDEGPRSTPAMTAQHVFTMSADGVVHCLELAKGEKVWSVETRKEFGSGKGFFGMACSPLVKDGLVLLNIGGRNGAGIVALDEKTGKLKWKATDHEASYSSSVAAKFGEKEMAVFLTREGVVGLNPGLGVVEFEFPFRSRTHASVNGASPMVIGNKIFVTASYDTGAALLEYKNGAVTPLWQKDGVLGSHYASVVHHNGYIFGFDGRQEYGPAFVCIELATGNTAWRKDGFGAGTVLLAGDTLVILKESGELVLAAAIEKEFRLVGEAQVIGNCRAYPALSEGFLYARDTKFLLSTSLHSP